MLHFIGAGNKEQEKPSKLMSVQRFPDLNIQIQKTGSQDRIRGTTMFNFRFLKQFPNNDSCTLKKKATALKSLLVRQTILLTLLSLNNISLIDAGPDPSEVTVTKKLNTGVRPSELHSNKIWVCVCGFRTCCDSYYIVSFSLEKLLKAVYVTK